MKILGKSSNFTLLEVHLEYSMVGWLPFGCSIILPVDQVYGGDYGSKNNQQFDAILSRSQWKYLELNIVHNILKTQSKT